MLNIPRVQLLAIIVETLTAEIWIGAIWLLLAAMAQITLLSILSSTAPMYIIRLTVFIAKIASVALVCTINNIAF
jgi:hypothetical protein